jgi:hypothetical protein
VFRAIDRHGRIAANLSDRAIALIVKRRVAAANIDPTGYSAHSLRAGCATEAAAHGVEERDIGRHTRHRSIAVLRGYIREPETLPPSATAGHFPAGTHLCLIQINDAAVIPDDMPVLMQRAGNRQAARTGV